MGKEIRKNEWFGKGLLIMLCVIMSPIIIATLFMLLEVDEISNKINWTEGIVEIPIDNPMLGVVLGFLIFCIMFLIFVVLRWFTKLNSESDENREREESRIPLSRLKRYVTKPESLQIISEIEKQNKKFRIYRG